MTNHPRRSRGPYTAEISASFTPRGPVVEFSTIRECRAWAEEFGKQAETCSITDRHGRLVARHVRDTSSDSLSWFRADV